MVFYMKIKQQKEDIANIKYGRDQNLRNMITSLNPKTIFNNKKYTSNGMRATFCTFDGLQKIIL